MTSIRNHVAAPLLAALLWLAFAAMGGRPAPQPQPPVVQEPYTQMYPFQYSTDLTCTGPGVMIHVTGTAVGVPSDSLECR